MRGMISKGKDASFGEHGLRATYTWDPFSHSTQSIHQA